MNKKQYYFKPNIGITAYELAQLLMKTPIFSEDLVIARGWVLRLPVELQRHFEER